MLRGNGNIRRLKDINVNENLNKKSGDVYSKAHLGGENINNSNFIDQAKQSKTNLYQENDRNIEPTQVLTARRISPSDVELKCIELADDIYRYLVHHEKKYVLNEDYMTGGQPTSKMRRILVDWLVQVHARFHLLPETLHLAIFVLDRMLAQKLVNKADLQLLGVASLYVASKYEEVFMPDLYDYEYITENSFNKQQILQMEQLILNSLQFDLSCPSSLVFARCISRLISDDENAKYDSGALYFAYNMSKYFGEMAFLESNMSSMPQSHIAMAAMSMALKLCPVDGIDVKAFEKKMIKQMDSSHAELERNVKLLAQTVLKQLNQNKLNAVKNKYQSTKLGQVANLINEESVEKLEEMASE